MRKFLLLLGFVLLVCHASGQDAELPFKLGSGSRAKSFNDLAEYKAEIEPKQAKPGETVTFKLTVTPKGAAWTYPAVSDQLSTNTYKLPKPGDVIFVGGVTDPPGWKEKPSIEPPGLMDRYYSHQVTWELKAVVSPKAAPGSKTVALAIGSKIQICNDNGCFFSDVENPPLVPIEMIEIKVS